MTVGIFFVPNGSAQYGRDMNADRKKNRPTYIRQWRKFRHLTQEQLADRVGVTQATIANVERGKRAYTQSLLEALADALMCGPADLLMRDPAQPDAIWSIWDQIPVQDRPQAMRVLRSFKKNGTDD